MPTVSPALTCPRLASVVVLPGFQVVEQPLARLESASLTQTSTSAVAPAKTYKGPVKLLTVKMFELITVLVATPVWSVKLKVSGSLWGPP